MHLRKYVTLACFAFYHLLSTCSATIAWSELAQQQCDAGQSPVRYIKTLQLTNDAKARTQLESALNVVRPIMCERKWAVGVIHEFLPLDQNLLGLNINAGEEIKIRLRWSNTKMVSFEQVLGTLLHELSHNAVSGHDESFWTMYKALKNRCEVLRDGSPCEDECLVASDAIDPIGELWARAGKCTKTHWTDESWFIAVICTGAALAGLLLICACLACRRHGLNSARRKLAKRTAVTRMSSMRQHTADLERAIQLSLGGDVNEDTRGRARLSGSATHRAAIMPSSENPDAFHPTEASMPQDETDLERAIQLSLDYDVSEDARRRPRLSGRAAHCASTMPSSDGPLPSTASNSPCSMPDASTSSELHLRMAVEASKIEF